MKPVRFEPDHYQDPRDTEECQPAPEPPCFPGPGHLHHLHPPGYPPLGGVGYGQNPDIELYDLIDFSMPVGNTGIVFVAGLTGFRESDGTARFIVGATAAAYRRAASTLAQMSLVAGSTFQFMRLAENLSPAQAAVLCGVPESIITDWEDGTTPVPPSSWQTMADVAAKADMRAGIIWTALPNVDLRPRRIRIYPDVPYNPIQYTPTTPPC